MAAPVEHPAATTGTRVTSLMRTQRSQLWITTALSDLYGPQDREAAAQLYEDFRLWLLQTGCALYGDFRWDDQSGKAVARQGDGHLDEISDDQWRSLLDFQAFDRWLAQHEFQRRRLQVVVRQLQRLGITPEIGASIEECRLTLTPESVLQLLYGQLRDRLGTPGWDELDQQTAEVALGVGSSGSSPRRDAAIRAAADPWVAAADFDGHLSPSAAGAPLPITDPA